MSDVDVSKVAGQALAEISIETAKNVTRKISSVFSKSFSYLTEDFESYLSYNYQKCGFVRTVLSKDKSYPLQEIYVPGVYSHDGIECSDEEIIHELMDGQPIVVMGLGGIGKTIFAKRLWLTIFESVSSVFPIFLELRQLNRLTKPDLVSYIRTSLAVDKGNLEEDVLKRFLEDGKFLFIFDGFDELRDDRKDEVEAQIIHLCRTYRNNRFVVSTRHSDRFGSWQDFKVFRSQPFSKEQVIQLIESVDFDKESKKKFLNEVIHKKYQDFEGFLSTPLLSLMMLMTYHQFAEVPEKRHIFYRYAFFTLYSWHDSSKESFRRENKTGLVVDQFEKAFSYFCLLSYLRYEIDFDEVSFIAAANRAKPYCEFSFDSQAFCNEITESVNLMFKEGSSYVFTHRSFQEYFSAYCVVNFLQTKIVDVTNAIRGRMDTVLSLMFEMNREVVEEFYMIPEGRKANGQLSKVLRKAPLLQVSSEIQALFIIEYRWVQRKQSDGVENKALTMVGRGALCLDEVYNFLRSTQQFYREDYAEVFGKESPYYSHNFDAEPFAYVASKVCDFISGEDELTLVYLPGENAIRFSKNQDSVPPYEDIWSWNSVECECEALHTEMEEFCRYIRSQYTFAQRMVRNANKKSRKKEDQLAADLFN